MMLHKLKEIIGFLWALIIKPREFYKLYSANKDKQEQEKKLYKSFYADFDAYNRIADNTKKAQKEFLYPCLFDKTQITKFDPTYFYQDAWAFERILLNKPAKHIDIGSHHKFVAHLSKVVDLTMIDIRPLSLEMESIKFVEGSILNLPFKDNSIDSLSSLCVIEHIGLGRYGDPIDPNGHEKAFKEIYRVLKQNAHFYLSVPVSNCYIVRFNAGVIFEYNSLITKIRQSFKICDMMFIAESQFRTEFLPDNNFGTTVLLDLIKK